MIIDTSALVAILRQEPEAAQFGAAIEAADLRRISAATYVEIAAVIDSRDPIAGRSFDDFLRKMRIAIEPVTEVQARTARSAYRDFGKRSGHPAQLNYGDTFAYALAKDLDEPLLFKGDDFRRTDIRAALA